MAESKSIRRFEYKGEYPPLRYQTQAQEIIFGDFEGERTYKPLTIKLARAYVPEFAKIPDNPYRHPAETYSAYQRFNTIANIIVRQLSRILTATDGVLENQRILDLGCGSTGETADAKIFGYHFQPWLCRTLYELRADPVGVDMGVLAGEMFETKRTNLLVPGALDFLPDSSIDVVHARALFNSPSLEEREDGQLMRVLDPQVARVLRPNGAFVYSLSF